MAEQTVQAGVEHMTPSDDIQSNGLSKLVFNFFQIQFRDALARCGLELDGHGSFRHVHIDDRRR